MSAKSRIVLFAMVVGALSLSSSRATAALPEEWEHWSHYREIQWDDRDGAHDRSIVRIALPEELFESARSDLADLRIVDEGAREAGYALFARGDRSATEWRSTTVSDYGFVPGKFTQAVVDTGDEAELHNAVEITLSKADEEFFTWAEVVASPDRETWRVVRARAPVYRFRERGFREAVTVSYPRTRDRWLRLRLFHDDEEVPIERVRVAERVESEAELVRVRRKLELRTDSPEGESRWEPRGEMNQVPIAAVHVATDQETFHRPVRVEVSEDGKEWQQVGEGTVYRYEPDRAEDSRDESTDLRQSLEVDVRNTSSPLWRVTVLDRDDPPLPDLEITLMQSRRYAIFRPAAGRSYRLLYGQPRAEAPEYEITHIVSRDDQAGAPLAELGPERTNDEWVSSEPFSERHPALLWVALLLAVAVLAALALKSLRA